ncbi:hypothetical protein HDU92_004411 [Lobulomyces angularis]|nr:hypothetical protein HDU92_004411 [Lobulomyces angularis]
MRVHVLILIQALLIALIVASPAAKSPPPTEWVACNRLSYYPKKVGDTTYDNYDTGIECDGFSSRSGFDASTYLKKKKLVFCGTQFNFEGEIMTTQKKECKKPYFYGSYFDKNNPA